MKNDRPGGLGARPSKYELALTEQKLHPETPVRGKAGSGDKSVKREKAAVVYTADGQAVCPQCFSKPKRGAKLHVSDDRIEIDGTAFRVLRTLQPCANPECDTNLIVSTAPSAAVADDHIATLSARLPLTARQRQDYETGSHDNDGIWRQASLF